MQSVYLQVKCSKCLLNILVCLVFYSLNMWLHQKKLVKFFHKCILGYAHGSVISGYSSRTN
jgi:hypothetical protein